MGRLHKFVEKISPGSYTIYTDGSRLRETEYKLCGAGWTIRTDQTNENNSIAENSTPLGDYDQNVVEITAIFRSLRWLFFYRHDDDDHKAIHIFTDSDLTCQWLTEPRVLNKYYRLVQRTRRITSYLTKYKIVLHWVPSHLGKNFEKEQTYPGMQLPINRPARQHTRDVTQDL